MAWTDKLKLIFGGKKWDFLDGVVSVEVPQTLYTKELAVHSAISLIANAISQCEIKVYKNGQAVKDADWYTLNVRPNPNQNASEFWHGVIERMYRADPGKGALVFTNNGGLFVADDYIRDEQPLLGDRYSNVSVGTVTLPRVLTYKNSLLFKLEEQQVNHVVAGMYGELDKLISAAYASYSGSVTPRWKFKIDAVEAGTEEFQQEWQAKIRKSVQAFVNGTAQVYVEYDGRELEPVTGSSGSSASASDCTSLIEEAYELISRAFHIPQGLLTGSNTNVSDLLTQFLTFAVDPVADMIAKTLTGWYSPAEFAAGNYYEVDTSKIKHFDILSAADDIDKLISSGFATINEIRELVDWGRVDDPLADKHVLTKNYETVEGGENDA